MRNLKLATTVVLLLILSLITTTGCRTIDPEPIIAEITLPPIPQREVISAPPGSLADAKPEHRWWIAKVLTYYESLVKQWEAWGKSVILIVLPHQLDAFINGNEAD